MLIRNTINSSHTLSINKVTNLLHVSRSGYYKWTKQPETRVDETKIRDQIQNIAVEYPRYGYRRITVELHKRGYIVNHKRVLRLMKEDNLLCVKKSFKPITTNSNHSYRVYPNLLKDIEINRINQVWASDITYIRLLTEFVYLSVVLDLFSRKCIGWDLGRNIDTTLTSNALQQAIKFRWNKDSQGLIHHSDQGVQYASNEYVNCLRDHDIEISMGAKGNPYDNAFVESFIKTLKWEEVYLNEYENFDDALENISRFIDIVYNQKRLHSSLGYKSPTDFEKEESLNTVT